MTKIMHDENSKIPWLQLKDNTTVKTDSLPEKQAYWERYSEGEYALIIIFDRPIILKKTLRFHGATASFGIRKDGRHQFQLLLLNPHDIDIFYRLCLDILSIPVDESKKYAFNIYKRIEQWILFLSKITSDEISSSIQKGLFAELSMMIFMNYKYNLNYSQILSAWKGPEKLSKDFIFHSIEIEVKAYSCDSITISNEYQLLAIDIPLYLVCFQLDEQDEGQTIHDKIQQIIGDINSNENELRCIFERKLLDYGYNPAVKYKNLCKYTINSIKSFIVDNDFPKLNVNNIPNCIHSVKYSINISFLNKFLHEIYI